MTTARERRESAETWRPVVGWEALYEVSDQGNVRSLRSGELLRPYSASHPYLRVTMSRPENRSKSHAVHALVAEAFLGPRPPGLEVRHGPRGRRDNSITNLCYGTPAENAADRLRDGTHLFGSAQPRALLTEEIVLACRQRLAAGETRVALAKEFGVHVSTMWLAVQGLTWRHVALLPPEALARKSPAHCPRGHPYNDENTYVNGRGHKECKACRRSREAARPPRPGKQKPKPEPRPSTLDWRARKKSA